MRARPELLDYAPAEMLRARMAIVGAVSVVVAGFFIVPWFLHAGTVQGFLGAFAYVVLMAGLGFTALWQWQHAGLLFEATIRARCRAVMREAGLALKSEHGRGFLYPRMRKITGSADAWSAMIEPHVGHTVQEWERALPRFSLAFNSLGARLRDMHDGRLLLRVGYLHVEGRTVEPAPPSLDPAPATDWRKWLERIPVGRSETGGRYSVPLIDSHVLVAGTTGAGKGSYIWSLLLGLLPAVRAGVVRLWGIDPKRLELSYGREFFGDRYAASPEDVLALLERLAEEMHTLTDDLAGKARRFTPSVETPLNVLVVDELGFVASLLPDTKQQKRADRALTTILILGRAIGYAVVGCLQDPRKSTLDYRDLFPTRVAMRLPAGMVDMVLGSGMYAAGAYCDQIPIGPAGAGMAFVLEDGTAQPLGVRFTWCSDDVIRGQAMALRLPAAPVRPKLPADGDVLTPDEVVMPNDSAA